MIDLKIHRRNLGQIFRRFTSLTKCGDDAGEPVHPIKTSIFSGACNGSI